jgi:hypothetical protein
VRLHLHLCDLQYVHNRLTVGLVQGPLCTEQTHCWINVLSCLSSYKAAVRGGSSTAADALVRHNVREVGAGKLSRHFVLRNGDHRHVMRCCQRCLRSVNATEALLLAT